MPYPITNSSNFEFVYTYQPANVNTMQIPAFRQLVERYLGGITVDPFARNQKLAQYTNDLNPDTLAEWHLKADEFLAELCKCGVEADLIIFDPPYSLEQAKRSYESFGIEFTYKDSHDVGRWVTEKDLCAKLLKPGGIFLHFGWHTNGMGKSRGFEEIGMVIVRHGSAHHNTLCLVERKVLVPNSIQEF